MKTLNEWRPTTFDSAWLGPEECQDWYVLPVLQTRDSAAFEQSNFAAALARLGGESETVQVLNFGHWGPGWFEIIVVAPARLAEAEEIADALENYPVLDEEDLCMREAEAASESWDAWGEREWRDKVIARFGDLLDAEELEALADYAWDLGKVSDLHEGGYFVEHDSSGPRFDFEGALRRLDLAGVRDAIGSGYEFENGARGPYWGLSAVEAHDRARADLRTRPEPPPAWAIAEHLGLFNR